jgi:hypothetical protein
MGSSPKDKEEKTRKKPGRVYVAVAWRVDTSSFVLDPLLVQNAAGSSCAVIKL